MGRYFKLNVQQPRIQEKSKPFQKVNEIPTSLIEHYIGFLRNVDLNSVSIDFLKEHYRKLIDFFSIKMITAPYYRAFYRARITTARNLEQLTYPPVGVTEYGRCNYQGESFFYCSNSYVTSVLEVKPLLDEIVTVLMLELNNDFGDLSNFCPMYVAARRSLNDDLMETFISCSDKVIQEKLDLIDSFFLEIMVQNVEKGNEWRYKSSIALVNAIREACNSRLCGIVYPSIASKRSGINFALHPEWIMAIKKPTYKAFRLKITEVGSSNIVAQIIESASQMDTHNNFLFNDVSHLRQYVNLDNKYYEEYEQAFNIQKQNLKEGSFFRRMYPPPILPIPYNLVHPTHLKNANSLSGNKTTI